MTLTSPPRVRPTSSFSWVPAAAGWTVGIIATLSLIASVSPGVRWLIKDSARVRQRLHLQLPRHQLRVGVRAGAAGRGAGGPQAHRLVDSGALHGRARSSGISATSSPATRRGCEESGEMIGLAFHVAAVAFLRAGPQGVLGQGASRRAGQGGRRAGRRDGRSESWSAGDCSSCSPARWSATTGWPTRSTGSRLCRRRCQRVRRPAPARLRQRASRPVRRAGADGRRDRAVPVAAVRERAHR